MDKKVIICKHVYHNESSPELLEKNDRFFEYARNIGCEVCEFTGVFKNFLKTKDVYCTITFDSNSALDSVMEGVPALISEKGRTIADPLIVNVS